MTAAKHIPSDDLFGGRLPSVESRAPDSPPTSSASLELRELAAKKAHREVDLSWPNL